MSRHERKANRGSEYTAKTLRAECKQVLPGFKWSVPRGSILFAVGTQSAGFNRTSTIEVTPSYGVEVALFGFGRASERMGHGFGATVTTAIRDLQNRLTADGRQKLVYARTIEEARPDPKPDYETAKAAAMAERCDELYTQLVEAQAEIKQLRQALEVHEREQDAADEAREALHDWHADYADRNGP